MKWSVIVLCLMVGGGLACDSDESRGRQRVHVDPPDHGRGQSPAAANGPEAIASSSEDSPHIGEPASPALTTTEPRATGEGGRARIRAAYIPLADHYAGIVAYEKYRGEMRHADYQIERMKSWPLLRAYFMSGEADVAYIISPQAMDMFLEEPSFRWVSLMHRDGNALAINDLLNADVGLPAQRADRTPDDKVATAFSAAHQRSGEPTEVGVPHLHATHTVVLYKYLKDNGLTLGLETDSSRDVVAIEVPPPTAPAFIKKKNNRGEPAAFEQSLPWADVVETGGYGHVAWYSKDVLPWPNGHVECIAIASDRAIADKRAALAEVIRYIHLAGRDIELARREGGAAMDEIIAMIRKHIPEHNEEAIVQSLDPTLDVINYSNLNLDVAGLRQIMDLAVEGGILEGPIDIDDFADNSFATDITGE
jgi:NitT/TauT family transport system substrate-binding protein